MLASIHKRQVKTGVRYRVNGRGREKSFKRKADQRHCTRQTRIGKRGQRRTRGRDHRCPVTDNERRGPSVSGRVEDHRGAAGSGATPRTVNQYAVAPRGEGDVVWHSVSESPSGRPVVSERCGNVSVCVQNARDVNVVVVADVAHLRPKRKGRVYAASMQQCLEQPLVVADSSEHPVYSQRELAFLMPLGRQDRWQH